MFLAVLVFSICFFMFDQKDAMSMLIPAIVPHLFVAIPKKIFQEIVRAVQSKGEGARLRYKEIDKTNIVFHKKGFQYAANLQCGTGEEKCDSWLTQSPFKPMLKEVKKDVSPPELSPFKPVPLDAKIGGETPSARLNKVLNARLSESVVLDKAVLLKSGRNSPNVAEDNSGIAPKFPTMNVRNADNHAEKCKNFINGARQARSELLLKKKDSLAETMGKTGSDLELAVKICSEKYEREYSMEFSTFFCRQIGEKTFVADTLRRTLHDAHGYASAKVLKYGHLSYNADMQNYGKFLSRFKLKHIDKAKQPAIPPRAGVLTYSEKPQPPALPPRTAAVACSEKSKLPPIPPRTGAARLINLPRFVNYVLPD